MEFEPKLTIDGVILVGSVLLGVVTFWIQGWRERRQQVFDNLLAQRGVMLDEIYRLNDKVIQQKGVKEEDFLTMRAVDTLLLRFGTRSEIDLFRKLVASVRASDVGSANSALNELMVSVTQGGRAAMNLPRLPMSYFQ